MDDINRWTVAQLKSELKLRGYPVSGNKKELFERLHNPPNDQEKGKPGNDGYLSIIGYAFYNTPFMPYLVVSLLFMAGGGVISYLTSEPIPDYELIEFDTDRTRSFAQDLVDLGHPE